MTWAAFGAVLSHWRANPWQLLTLIMGLATATALWSGVQAINTEARASYAAASDQLTDAAVGRITAINGDISLAEFVAIRRAGWRVSPLVEGKIGGVNIVGFEPLTFPRRSTEFSQDGAMSSFLGTPNIILAHRDDMEVLQNFGLEVRADDTQQKGRVLSDIATAQRLLSTTSITTLLVHPDQPMGQAKLGDVAPNLRQSNVQNGSDISRLTDSFHLNLTAFGLLAFAVGIFIVYGAIGLAFEQRRPVFRTLRTLGLSLRKLMFLLAVELFIFAVFAGCLGIALGYLIAAALLPDVAATLRGLYGADVTGTLSLRPVWWVSGLLMALAGTALAAAGAMAKLHRMPLMASNSPRAMVRDAGRSARYMGLASLFLLSAALLLLVFSTGLIAGFVLLGCLLIGAALALPPLLNITLWTLSKRSKKPLIQWFWADTQQQVPGLSMALMALLLAMAANIGVSTMVSSFRLTFIGYLDQRLSSELYLRFDTPTEAQEVLSFITPKVNAVLPIVSEDIRVGDRPAEIFGIINHATYREFWPLLDSVPDVWDKVFLGEGVLINEQLARRQNLWINDDLNGDVVLGIYSDYGNSSGQIIIDNGRFMTRYPDAEPLRFGLRTDTPEAISELLWKQFNLTGDKLIDQQGIKQFSISVFERTFAVTTALNILTLSVAGLAILISLLTLATMRLPQLAPVWALGLTRRKLAWLELIRALSLAAFTGLVAVPLGLALAWVLLAVLNVEAFGWRLPMYLFPIDYLKLGALTLCAAFLAALWPAIKLSRTPPNDLLKVFSNER
jgi:putative ABC transport system permease protein